jgi:CubicO group peptidase (beta-lactamase class C family)
MSHDDGVAPATRRKFLLQSSRAGIGLSLLSLAGCSGGEATTAKRMETGAAATAKWDALTADLEKRLPAVLAQSATVPGASMALIADGKLLWRGAFGVKDHASKIPVDHETIFEAGSVSKTVFAYAAMKLCEKGVIGLDTPLTKYTPDRFVANDPRLDQITARHILCHTSGFQNWRSKKDPLKIQFAPGERWDYSGEGYAYLQSVMTRLTGHVDPNNCTTYDDGVKVCATDFDAYMKENLFIPFGMTSSGYVFQERMARPHDEKGNMRADRMPTAVDAARYGAAGNLHTTPTEYARFLIEFIDPKPIDGFRLSAASLKEMSRPHAKVNDSQSWGLGWAIEHDKVAGDIINHGGDNPGFKALTAASIERKSAFVIMTNGDRGFEDVIAKVVMSEQMQRFLPFTLMM